jgi:hypothetical protein
MVRARDTLQEDNGLLMFVKNFTDAINIGGASAVTLAADYRWHSISSHVDSTESGNTIKLMMESLSGADDIYVDCMAFVRV